MKTARLFPLALLVVALASASSAKILVQLKDAQGKVVGTAILWDHADAEGGRVGMELNFENLPPAEHTIHFHQNAKCEAPDFNSAGCHFKPHTTNHDSDNP